ncbi:MAG: LacI family DNA-binding transcriptional regulator [Phycisphaeraceae bacterium]
MTSSSDKIGSVYDLAQRTGYSTSTISRVLNQRGRISAETRRRVLAAAREVGFRPRAAVRQNTVAIVMDRLRYATYGGFVSSMMTHLISELARYDIAVEVYTEDNVERLGSRFIDGVLALSWDQTTIARLRSLENVPVVVINRMDLDGFSVAASDHHQGGRLVGDYLLKCGHREIAFLAEEHDWGAQQRIEGVKAAMQAAGLDGESLRVAFTQHQPVYGALRRVLDEDRTALFLAGEDLTIEAMYILNAIFGIRVPDDLSVVGLENEKVSQFVHPPLTSLAQPLDQLATETLKLIVKHIREKQSKPAQSVVDNKLIQRESVRKLKPDTV